MGKDKEQKEREKQEKKRLQEEKKKRKKQEQEEKKRQKEEQKKQKEEQKRLEQERKKQEQEEKKRQKEEKKRLQQQKKEEKKRQKEEKKRQKEEKKKKHQALVTAYKKQPKDNQKGLDGKVKCKSIKSAVEVTLESTEPKVRAIEAGEVTFAARNKTLTRAISNAKAYLPLKAPETVSVIGKVTKPKASRFKEAEQKGEVIGPEDDVGKQTLQFTPCPYIGLRVQEEGTDAPVKDVTVKLKQPDGKALTMKTDPKGLAEFQVGWQTGEDGTFEELSVDNDLYEVVEVA